jgi:acetyl esterase
MIFRSIPTAAILIAINLASFAVRAADDQPEPTISWKYPPEMTGSRVEVYRAVGDVKLNAYIFEPKGHAKTDRRPVAVFFFGGGWKGGTPGQFLPQCLHLAERGMMAISVDYRVKSRHNVFPQDCVRDAKAAIRWVRANAQRLGVDPDRVVAGGGSSGGHLAAATALLPGFEDDDNKGVSSTPNAMLLFNPAVVMAPVDGHPDLLPAEKFADIAERCDGRPQEVSPYHFVRAGLPPSVIFHGMNDEAVPFPTVQLFQKAMSAAGNRCELKAYEGQPHGFFNPGRWKDEAGAGAKLHYYKTLAEVDASSNPSTTWNPRHLSRHSMPASMRNASPRRSRTRTPRCATACCGRAAAAAANIRPWSISR